MKRKKRRNKNTKYNKVVYIIVVAIITAIINLFSDNLSFNDVPDIPVNEDIGYNKVEKENKFDKLDINKIEYEDFLSTELTKSKIDKIIDYRAFVGYIDDINDIDNIKGFGKKDMGIVRKYFDTPTKGEYNKWYIYELDYERLRELGLSSKSSNKILNSKINNEFELKEILKNKEYEKIRKYIKW